MLSWGILPQQTGGLEKVTYYLCKFLPRFGHKVHLIIPKKTKDVEEQTEKKINGLKIYGLNYKLIRLPNPYVDYKIFLREEFRKSPSTFFSSVLDYYRAAEEYARQVLDLVDNLNLDFDIIYANDWLTSIAALKLKEKYGKPLIVHIHSTAFDRTGGAVDVLPHLKDYWIEREVCEKADAVIAVSGRIKDILVNYYGIDPAKIQVVYNAPDEGLKRVQREGELRKIKSNYHIVLFLGRMTLHKGPDWLLKAAKRVLEKRKDVLFVFAGKGEMLPQLINEAARMGISKNVVFTGWVSDEEREILYDIADIFVLPSLSEPFGLTPFEALTYDTPIIISKQSGVAEVLRHAFIVDFWDVNKMADYILAILEYPVLRHYSVKHCIEEMKKLSWKRSVGEISGILEKILER